MRIKKHDVSKKSETYQLIYKGYEHSWISIWGKFSWNKDGSDKLVHVDLLLKNRLKRFFGSCRIVGLQRSDDLIEIYVEKNKEYSDEVYCTFMKQDLSNQNFPENHKIKVKVIIEENTNIEELALEEGYISLDEEPIYHSGHGSIIVGKRP